MFKLNDEVRIIVGGRLKGEVGRIVAFSESRNGCLVDFGKEIRDGNGHNIPHNGSQGTLREHYYWFTTFEVESVHATSIQVIITYQYPERYQANSFTYVEHDTPNVEDAIGNAMLESGLDKAPELVLSITAMKIVEEE